MPIILKAVSTSNEVLVRFLSAIQIDDERYLKVLLTGLEVVECC